MFVKGKKVLMEIKKLQASFNKSGKIKWIGIRPARRADLKSVSNAAVKIEEGLEGDHYKGKSKKRQITIIQAEHLEVVAKLLDQTKIDPMLTRRNIVIEGINLIALKKAKIRIGDEVVLEVTGPCDPCSRMEENLGKGGYNAMRGHGGMCTKVIKNGNIQVGDAVVIYEESK